MNELRETKQRADLRDYLAAERTLLAWIRTALALMGFGFVVARFGLFLQQLQIAQHAPAVQSYGLSLWFGTALIGASVAVNLVSGWHHVRLIRTLSAGRDQLHSTTLAVSTSVFLALVGLAMTAYLVFIRGSANAQLESTKETSMAQPAPVASGKGIVNKLSNHSVDQTVENLKGILQAKGVTLFAMIDHSGEADKVGMKMRPTKLLIFGSPKAGTPLMLAAPSIAIDLPLKVLVWEDNSSKVWLSFNSPEYLRDRHGLSQALLQNIAVVENLARAAAE